MIGDIEGGVSPFKIFGKRRKGGTKAKVKGTKTAKRRGGFSKSTKTKNIPGFNRATSYKYFPKGNLTSRPKSPQQPISTKTGIGGQPIIDINISDLIDLNIANALGDGTTTETEKVTTIEETNPQMTRIEEYVDKYGRKPSTQEAWDMNLQYKNYPRPQDKFSTFEEYDDYVKGFYASGNTIDMGDLKNRSRGAYDKIKGNKIITKEEVNIIRNEREGTNPVIIQNIKNDNN